MRLFHIVLVVMAEPPWPAFWLGRKLGLWAFRAPLLRLRWFLPAAPLWTFPTGATRLETCAMPLSSCETGASPMWAPAWLSPSQGARVIDCTGKYLIPGLVDGLAGMNSQGQANAYLYMGVTTVVVRSDVQHGSIDFTARPSPHLYLVDSIVRPTTGASWPSAQSGRSSSGRAHAPSS